MHRCELTTRIEHYWYLRASKTEAEEAGLSVDGMATSTAKLRDEILALTGGKLNIEAENGDFKSTFQILKELSEIWDEIGEKAPKNQARLLELMGGKRNANVLSSIITNFQDAIDASETAASSMGSAWEENEKYLSSIEGKTKQVQASFEAFANSVVGSGVVTTFLSIQKGILDIATALSKVGFLAPTVMALFTSFKTISDMWKSGAALQKITDIFTLGAKQGTAFENLETAANSVFLQLTPLQRRMVALKADAVAAGTAGSESMQRWAATASATNVQTGALAAGQERLKLSTLSLSQAYQVLKSSVSFWVTVATVIISAISSIINANKQAAEEAANAAREIRSSFEENQKTYNDNMKSLEKIGKRFNVLKEGVDENKANLGLTNEEYEEFIGLVDQIVDISPSVVSAYNDEGYALRNGYTQALTDAIAEQEKFLANSEQMLINNYQDVNKVEIEDLEEKWKDYKDLWRNQADYTSWNAGMSAWLDWRAFLPNPTADDAKEYVQAWQDVLKGLDIDPIIDLVHRTANGQEFDIYDYFLGDPDTSAIEWYSQVYSNVDEIIKRLRSVTRQNVDENGNIIFERLFSDEDLDRVRNSITNMFSGAPSAVTAYVNQVKRETESLIVYLKHQPSLEQIFGDVSDPKYITDFASGLSGAFDIFDDVETKEAAAVAYLKQFSEAINDINYALGTGSEYDTLRAWNELQVKWAGSPSILKFIQKALFGTTSAQQQNAGATKELTNAYEHLSDAMSNASSASSLLEKLKKGTATLEDTIPTLKKMTDEWNKAFPENQKSWTDFAAFTANGDLDTQGTISLINEYIDAMVDLAFSDSDFATTHADTVAKIKAGFKEIVDSANDARTVKNVLEELTGALSFAENIKSYKQGEKSPLDMIEQAVDLADKYKNIKLGDLISFDGSQIGFQMDAAQALIESRASELAETVMGAMLSSGQITTSQVEETRQKLKAIFSQMAKDAEKETDTVKDAITQVGNAFSYMKDLSAYKEGEKSMFDMLSSVQDYAEKNKVELSSLITWDEQAGTIEFADLTEEAINGLIQTLATKLQIGDDHLDAFSAAVKESFREAAEEARTLQDVFDDLGDALSFAENIRDFGKGNKTPLDMLEQAYKLAQNTEGLGLSDLINWDGTSISFQMDAAQALIEARASTLAETVMGAMLSAGKITTSQVAETRERLKQIFSQMAQETEEETDDIKNALTKVGDAFDYIKDVSSFKAGEKSLFETLESLKNYADKNNIDLSTLITWNDQTNAIEFVDLTEAEIDNLINTLAEKLKIGEDHLEEFAEAVRASFEEAAKETRTLQNVFDELGDALSFGESIRAFQKGEKTPLDVLEQAFQLAEKTEGINFADLINWDGSTIAFQMDTAQTLIERRASTLAESVAGAMLSAGKITTAEFAEVREKLKQTFSQMAEETTEEVDNVKKAITGIGDAFSYMKELSSYKSGEKTMFDMIEQAKEYADKNGIKLSDLVKWDEGARSLEFIDLADKDIDAFIATLAEQLGVGDESLGAFSDAVKASFEEVAEEARTLQNVFDELGSAMSFAENIKAYQQGEKTPLDMLEQAYKLAESNKDVNFADLFDWNGAELTFQMDTAQDMIASRASVLAETVMGAMLSSGKITTAQAAETREKLKKIFSEMAEETEEEVDTVKNAITSIGDAFSYMKDLSAYKAGEKTLFDMIESMKNYADKKKIVDLSKLVKWDEDRKTLEFIDIADAEIDAFIQSLATSLNIGEDGLAEFSEAVKKSFKETAKEARTLQDVFNELGDALSFAEDIKAFNKGEKTPLDMLEQAFQLAEKNEGINLTDLIQWNGSEITFQMDTAQTLIESRAATIAETVMGAMLQAGQITTSQAAETREKLKKIFSQMAEDAEKAVFEISDAMSGFSEAVSFKNAFFNPDEDETPDKVISDALSMMEAFNKAVDAKKISAQKLSLSDFITIDGTKVTRDIAQVETYASAMIEIITSGITDEAEKESVRQALQAYFDGIKKETETGAEGIAQAVSKISSAMDFQSSVFDKLQSGDLLGVIKDLDSLKEAFGDAAKGWTWSDFFDWDGQDLVYKTGVLKSQIEQQAGEIASAITQSLIDAGKVAEADAETTYKRIVNTLTTSTEQVKSAYEQLNEVVNKVKNVNTYNENIEQYNRGEISLLDMLTESASVAEELGVALEDAFDFDTMQPKAEAVTDALDKAVDDLVAAKGYSREFADQLKEAARAAQKTQQLSDIYKNVKDMAGNAGNYGREKQLTYDDYNAMISVDPRYAETIEYVNGVLTVNAEAHNKVTAEIAAETAEMALLEAAQRKLKYEELQRELAKNTSLTNAERASMQKVIDKLKLEAKGFMVLANEISNATNQFERFRAASDSPEAQTFMDAKSALKILEDVLYNTESEIYGQLQHEKFQEAVKLLIDPEINFADPNWVEKVKEKFGQTRQELNDWFGEGTEKDPRASRENTYAFWEYLNREGFATDEMDEAGNRISKITGNVEEMANTFHTTKDAIRAALQQMERFGITKFDWEAIDPEYFRNVMQKAEELQRAAEEAKAKAAQAEEDAAKAKTKAEEASKELTQAQESGDETRMQEAQAKADAANAAAAKAAEEAKQAAAEAQASAEAAAQKAAEQEQTGTDGLQKSLEEIIKQVEDLTTQKIDLDVTSAIESLQSVTEQFDEIITKINELSSLNESLWGSGGGTIGDDSGNVFANLSQSIQQTQADMESLQQTGEDGVDVETGEGIRNVESLTHSVLEAESAIAYVDGSDIGVGTSTAVDNVNTLTGAVNDLSNAIDAVNKKSVSPSVPSGSSGGGGGPSGGNATAGGTMSSPGGKTLVGELGREMVVDVDTGRWYTVGNNGPEFVNLPKKAIVFNHLKTAELLGDRKLDLSGVSMAAGTRANSSVNGTINLSALATPVNATQQAAQQITQAIEEAADEIEETLEDKLDAIKEAYDLANKVLDHLIQHEEFSYYNADRAANYDKMHTYLANEIEIYKAIMRNSQEGIAELRAAGADDGSEQLQELEESYWAAYRSMYDALDKIRSLYTDRLDDEVDNIQAAFKNLTNAAKEYNSTGLISIDTFQSILDNGVEYLGFLKNENGQFEINKNTVQNMLKLRKDQLAIETAIAYVNRLQEALQKGEANKVNEMVNATGQIGRNTWSIVYANLEAARAQGLTNEQYQAALQNLQNLQELAQVAMDDLGMEDAIADARSEFEVFQKEIEHYIKHQEFSFDVGERALNFTQMNQALENEVAYYKRITEEAQKTIADMVAKGAEDTNENLQAVEEAYWSAYHSMYDTIDKMRALRVDALTQRIGDLTGAFSDLMKASDEYNEMGGISLTTLQSLLDNGIEYMSLLDEENGKYVIAKDRVAQYVQERKNQLAVETALSYLGNVREALENKEDDRLQKLLNVQDGVTTSTWGMVYAQAALLKTSGLSNDQYETLIANIDKMKTLADSVVDEISDGEGDITEQYDKQKDAMSDILKYTEDLIRYETNERINGIKKEIDAYKEIIELKKQSIDQTKTESEYQDEVAEKVMEIAELQAKADLLSLDTSRTAAVERQKLLQEIADKQKDLSKTQNDYAIDAQKAALDEDYENYEKARNDEIETLERSISSEEKVYQLAIARIRDQWGTLYQDLIAWNTEEGSVINDEITTAWDEATKAVERYGSAVEAMKALTTEKQANYIVADIPKYHSGGLVGEEGSINEKEVLAVLKKGEVVVNNPMKKALYTAVDFVKALSERLGSSVERINNFAITGLAGQMAPAFATPNAVPVTQNNQINFSPVFNVELNGADIGRRDAASFGREIADVAANDLFEAFNKRGINAIRTLRQ